MIDDLLAPRKPKRENLKREAETYLRDLIHSGELKRGERLDQDKIAADLGFSRLPVREAIITLESEGLIENIARRGAFVAHIEKDDILDHYRMYGLVSSIAAARVAELKPPELIERLEIINQQMREATEPARHDLLNFAFHQAINKGGGSRRLIAVLKTLSASMPSNYFQHNTEWEYKHQAIEEHDRVVEAIRNGDPKEAAEQMQLHFAHTGNQAVRMLENAGFWSDRE